MKHILSFSLTLLCLSACTTTKHNVRQIVTTPSSPLVEQQVDILAEAPSGAHQVNILTDQPGQTIDGFGACFNELGWDALMMLDSSERRAIMAEMFAPGGDGAEFTVCRMPIAANDFSRDWYSYNETPGDFDMATFSIDRDSATLVPFIQSALQQNPSLRLWASPWSPPTWMKLNGHYAMDTNLTSRYANGLLPSQRGAEGVDFFKQEPRYLKAYADYFRRFVEAYSALGIKIEAVAPQNEFNSCQIFPSCTWTAAALDEFVGKHLGPVMDSIGVDVWFGTMERGNAMLVDTILSDPLSARYVKAVGFQWAGKDAVAEVHRLYPDMKIVQSESECGDGQNSWDFCFYTWSLVKHYMRHGATVYEYWNIALQDNGLSRWGWRQNSLVSVDPENRTFRYNPEYYLMKHLSRYVKPGARHLPTSGTYDDIIAFVNPDGEMVVMAVNSSDTAQNVAVNIDGKTISLSLAPQSINTVQI